MTARLHIGDTRAVLATLPDASVDLVLTSSPFLALRSYLPADDPAKHLEIGAEPTPGEFIDTLLDIVVELRRVLTPTGSMCWELGDTYAGSGGGGGDYLPGGLRDGQPGFGGSADRQRDGNAAHWRAKNARRDAWPLDKSLCLVPQLFSVALAYGLNPLTGRRVEPWRVRNVVRWVRPNPPVGALGDKFRPATSEMAVACTAGNRWFDLDAVRGPAIEPTVVRVGTASASKGISGGDSGNPDKERLSGNPAGAPPLDWWEISTQPYKGAHYATWPEELCVKPILAMCPQKVCTTCGEPSRRNVEVASHGDWRRDDVDDRQAATVGWSDCGHNTWRRGIVLDPFAGSGTTLAVAEGHGRDSIGIDLDSRNEHLIRERVGMWLEVVEPGAAA